MAVVRKFLIRCNSKLSCFLIYGLTIIEAINLIDGFQFFWVPNCLIGHSLSHITDVPRLTTLLLFIFNNKSNEKSWVCLILVHNRNINQTYHSFIKLQTSCEEEFAVSYNGESFLEAFDHISCAKLCNDCNLMELVSNKNLAKLTFVPFHVPGYYPATGWRHSVIADVSLC